MASTIKVDNVQNQPGTNVINKCGTTITLGASGDTVSLASGASQTGFGRTGTVDWETTPKTATFTAVNGKGYFCNTGGGTFEMDLPAGSAGAIVSVQDYNNTFDTAALTVDPNGSEKINGGVAGAKITLSTEGLGITFVYVDSTVGWRSVHSNEYAQSGQSFMAATGGNTVTTSGDYKIHTFTGPGTFCVSAISGCAPMNNVSYMVVAGGGSGSKGGPGTLNGAGGGAGGFREYKSPTGGCYTASPLDGNPGGTSITVSATGYPITVGGGGSAIDTDGNQPGNKGSDSIFSTVTSTGGGAGRMSYPSIPSGTDSANGGSGGGGAAPWPSVGNGNTPVPGGAGNSPPVSPSQGNTGGTTTTANNKGAGGGGATAVGTNTPAPAPDYQGSPGGAGATTSITASPVAYAGGGGGAGHTGGGTGGTGGGGNGGTSPSAAGTAGTTNRGGGGGGGTGNCAHAANGGSGIVIIRYKYQ